MRDGRRPGRRRSRSRPRSARAWPRTPSAPSSTAARSTCASRSRADGAFRIFTAKSPEAGEFVRHSAEHVLADAVKRLWPEAEIDAGRKDHSEKFQYDFRFARAFTPEDLEKIEAKMREILAEDSAFERVEVSREEAERLFREMGETLKVERLDDIPEGETITLYRHGRFTDLCRGPHVQRAVADRRGQAARGLRRLLARATRRNEMLQRIYGTAFASQKELDELPGRGSRRRGRATTAASARSSTSSASTRWRRRCRSSTPRGRSSTTRLIDYVRELQTRATATARS